MGKSNYYDIGKQKNIKIWNRMSSMHMHFGAIENKLGHNGDQLKFKYISEWLIW